MHKKKKKFLTVYTVSYGKYCLRTGMTHTVVGSFLSRGDAIRECSKLLLDKLSVYPEARVSFLRNKDADSALKKANVDADLIESFFGMAHSNVVGLEMPRAIEEALMPYVSDVIGSDSCYMVKCFSFSQRDDMVALSFDVDESDMESRDGIQLWTCITSGEDSDGHDPEFEQPFPEVFFSEEEAMECALEDLRQCLDGYERAQKTEILCEARDQLEKDGYYEFELNDSTSRRWDIWSTPIDIGQGSGKIQRP